VGLNLFEVEVYPKGMNSSFRSSSLRELVRAGVMFAVAVALVLVPRAALAHAVLVQSTPTINATVEGPDVAISMKFSLRVDGARSTVLLSTDDGNSKPLALDRQSAPDTLITRAAKLSPGNYAIHWQVLATDGHVTRGEIPFRVK
jgi:methionine-rich copper-binding protein CopC